MKSAAALLDALATAATAVDVRARGCWAVTFDAGLVVSASADDGWLRLAAPADVAVSAVDLLERNARLSGGARVVLHPDLEAPQVRVELPLDDEVDLVGRIREASAGLAAARWRTVEEGVDPAAGPVVADDDLAERCRETGWEVASREPGRLAVALDVPGTLQHAVVERRGDGSVAVAVPVLDPSTVEPQPAAEACRTASALLLLAAGGVVRMVRAAATTRDGTLHAWLEVVFATRPRAVELAHAFAALSVAYRLVGREVAVLWGDETVARTYLEQWNQRREEHHGTGSSNDRRASGE